MQNIESNEKKPNERLKATEKEALQERAIKEQEKAKKQILLRLSSKLWNDIAAWAEEDFRSINGQIEFLLSDCVNRHKKL